MTKIIIGFLSFIVFSTSYAHTDVMVTFADGLSKAKRDVCQSNICSFVAGQDVDKPAKCFSATESWLRIRGGHLLKSLRESINNLSCVNAVEDLAILEEFNSPVNEKHRPKHALAISSVLENKVIIEAIQKYKSHGFKIVSKDSVVIKAINGVDHGEEATYLVSLYLSTDSGEGLATILVVTEYEEMRNGFTPVKMISEPYKVVKALRDLK